MRDFKKRDSEDLIIVLRLLLATEQFPRLSSVIQFLSSFQEFFTAAAYGWLAITEEHGDPRHTMGAADLHLLKLKKESPLEIVTFVGALPASVAATWALLQIAEKISNSEINRELLELQRRKLREEFARLEGPKILQPGLIRAIEKDLSFIPQVSSQRLDSMQVSQIEVEITPNVIRDSLPSDDLTRH